MPTYHVLFSPLSTHLNDQSSLAAEEITVSQFLKSLVFQLILEVWL